jgi:hypothetical protein
MSAVKDVTFNVGLTPGNGVDSALNVSQGPTAVKADLVGANNIGSQVHGGPGNDVVDIRMREKDSSSHVAENVFKPEYTIFLGNKKFILTETIGTDAGPQQVGHSQEEWERIATSMQALYNEIKTNNPDFTISVARFNSTTGKFEYRLRPNESIVTEELYTGPSQQTVKDQAHHVHTALTNNPGKPLHYISKPSKPSQLQPNPQQQLPGGQPQPNQLRTAPMDLPPPPPDDNRWWIKKQWDRIWGNKQPGT